MPYDQVSFAEHLSDAIAHIIDTHVTSTGIYDQDELLALSRMPDARVNSTRRPDAHIAVEAGATDRVRDGVTIRATDGARETALSADDLAFLREHYRDDYTLWSQHGHHTTPRGAATQPLPSIPPAPPPPRQAPREGEESGDQKAAAMAVAMEEEDEVAALSAETIADVALIEETSESEAKAKGRAGGCDVSGLGGMLSRLAGGLFKDGRLQLGGSGDGEAEQRANCGGRKVFEATFEYG